MTGPEALAAHGPDKVHAAEVYASDKDARGFFLLKQASGRFVLMKGTWPTPLPATDFGGVQPGLWNFHEAMGCLPGAAWEFVAEAVVRAAADKLLRRAVTAGIQEGAAGKRRYVSVYDGPLSPAYAGSAPRYNPDAPAPPPPRRFSGSDADFRIRRAQQGTTGDIAAAAAAVKGAVSRKELTVYHEKRAAGDLLNNGAKVYAHNGEALIEGFVDWDAQTRAAITVSVTDWDSVKDGATWYTEDEVPDPGSNPQNAPKWGTSEAVDPLIVGVPPALPGERMFHCPSVSGGKWWGIRLGTGALNVVIRFGPVNQDGQEQVIGGFFTDPERRTALRDRVTEKINKGYKEVGV